MDATRFSFVSAGLLATLLAAGCGDDAPADADAQPIDGSVVIDGGELADARLVDATPPPDSVQPTCTPVNGTTLTTEVVADDLDSPVLVTAPPGDGRLFVVEQPGRIRIIKDGELLGTPFLDLSQDGGPVNAIGNEQGLLGLAFHPEYAVNGRFFVYYTANDPFRAIVIAEYHVSGDPDISGTAEERLLEVDHSENSNHNGGTIEFSPTDGYLYAGLGDGGSGGDPDNNGENEAAMLGSLLRIDVDQPGTPEKPYGIPASNPYADSEDGPNDPRPEVWAKGLRNPYRWTFDSNGDLYIGDVGQDTVEEVDVQLASSAGGEDYGWDIWEGDFCHEAPAGAGGVCPTAGYTDPVVTLDQSGGYCSVIGGAVYRGVCFPDIQGWYFYTDFCNGSLRSFEWDGDSAENDRQLGGVSIGSQVTSIHTDALGEIYMTNRGGAVRRLVVEAN